MGSWGCWVAGFLFSRPPPYELTLNQEPVRVPCPWMQQFMSLKSQWLAQAPTKRQGPRAAQAEQMLHTTSPSRGRPQPNSTSRRLQRAATKLAGTLALGQAASPQSLYHSFGKPIHTAMQHCNILNAKQSTCSNQEPNACSGTAWNQLLLAVQTLKLHPKAQLLLFHLHLQKNVWVGANGPDLVCDVPRILAHTKSCEFAPTRTCNFNTLSAQRVHLAKIPLHQLVALSLLTVIAPLLLQLLRPNFTVGSNTAASIICHLLTSIGSATT